MDNNRPLSLPFHEIEKLLLKCSVCRYDLVDEKTSLAHLLPCLHTMCRSCLLENVPDTEDNPKTLQCVECQEVHKLSTGDPSKAFPVDNTRLDLWEFVQLKKSVDGMDPECSVCDGVKASTRCVDCAEFLCIGCTSAHERTSKTKHHEIKDLSQLKTTDNLQAFRSPLTCPLHGEPFAVYCSKWTCEKPVCPMCTFTTCKASEGHHILSLKEATAQLKSDLEEQIRKTRNIQQEVQKVETLVEWEVENIDQHEKDLEKDIDTTIDEMMEMLKEKRVELKNDLKKKIETKRGILNKQKEVLHKREVAIVDAVQFAEQALCCSNDAAYSQVDKHVVKRLEHLQHDQFDSKPHENALVCFDKSRAMAALQTNIKENLNVSAISVFPPFTTVESWGEHTENHVTKISVSLRDYMRRPTDLKGSLSEKMKIKVEDPLGRKTVLQMTDHNPTGPMVFTYVPFLAGNHVTYVEVMGKDISHKNFDVSPDESVERNRKSLNFTFDNQTAHSDVTVRDEGRTFENFSTISPKRNNQLLEKRYIHFKGTRGSVPFKKGGIFTYEIDVQFWVKKVLGARELVFEIGLALESAIDNRLHVEGQPNCWSMIGSQHPECDGLCLIMAHEGQSIFHEKMANNQTDCVFSKSFRFRVDMKKGLWEICDNNRKLCSLDIRTENPLYPVISGYNPASVLMKAELKSS